MKICILDKDGTLTKPKSQSQFCQNPEDQILIPGVVQSLYKLNEEGYFFYIASNQYGIGKGYKTLDSAVEEIRYCVNLLAEKGIKINQSLICPDYNGKRCIVINGDAAFQFPQSEDRNLEHLKLVGKFRKPNPGMLLALKHDQFTEFLMIGNQESDRIAAKNAKFNYMDIKELIKYGKSKENKV
jgi:D-glycero-D-manno-heptose 1,7-bisphosphate phosphatase